MAKKTAPQQATTERYVMVTTAHRGVFAGVLDGDGTGETVTLRQARMCVYWSAAMRGVLGLAAIGPDADCKIGPAVEALTLRNVTAVIDVTPAARERWEQQPWRA